MSVHVEYFGRFGNHAFQYCCARLFGRDNGLQVVTRFPDKDQKILPVSRHEAASIINAPEITLTDDDVVLGAKYAPASYTLRGFFQDAEVLYRRRYEVGQIFRPRPVERRPYGDFAINIRMGVDYQKLNMVIHPSWYLAILAEERFDQLFIVVDNVDPAYLEYFEHYDPVVVKTTPDKDWDFLRSFQRLVCSNSTFGWWAAYFGKACRIYTFDRWSRNLSRGAVMTPVKGLYWHEWPEHMRRPRNNLG